MLEQWFCFWSFWEFTISESDFCFRIHSIKIKSKWLNIFT
jgi:hypothetical protein